MLRKIIYPVIALILLSSCANKFSLQKRKYSKGFYFASAKNNSKKDESVKVSHLKAKPVSTTLTDEKIVKTDFIPSTETIEPFVKITPGTEKQFPKLTQSNPAIVASVNKDVIQTEKTFKNVALKSEFKNSLIPAKGSSDTNLIIMIILCLFIFINLIPVYLHDGKSITLNFWITLLLDFTFIGGIIFALLVVLDVVDLK